MSNQPRVQEVFADVEVDPDTILANADVDSPDELVDSGGRHDPIDPEMAPFEPTDPIEPTETTVTDVLTELADSRLEVADDTEELDPGSSDRDNRDADQVASEVALGAPSVTILDGDGRTIDEMLAPDRPRAEGADARSEPELVGGGPTVTRIEHDAVGWS